MAGGARSPPILQDRRVEITGPTDRKMVINALNSGAKVFMTDFEDSNSPTWDNLVRGQINLRDRWSGAMDYRDPDSGKHYVSGQAACGAHGAAARLASAGKPYADRRPDHVRRAF